MNFLPPVNIAAVEILAQCSRWISNKKITFPAYRREKEERNNRITIERNVALGVRAFEFASVACRWREALRKRPSLFSHKVFSLADNVARPHAGFSEVSLSRSCVNVNVNINTYTHTRTNVTRLRAACIDDDVENVMQAETRILLGNTGWLYLRRLPFLARRSIVRGRPIYLPYTLRCLGIERCLWYCTGKGAFSILPGSSKPFGS